MIVECSPKIYQFSDKSCYHIPQSWKCLRKLSQFLKKTTVWVNLAAAVVEYLCVVSVCVCVPMCFRWCSTWFIRWLQTSGAMSASTQLAGCRIQGWVWLMEPTRETWSSAGLCESHNSWRRPVSAVSCHTCEYGLPTLDRHLSNMFRVNVGLKPLLPQSRTESYV